MLEDTIKNETETTTVKHTLFGGAIGYNSPSDYESFLKELNKSQALHMLISGVNYAQTKGAYSIQEAELLAASIRIFISKPVESQLEPNP